MSRLVPYCMITLGLIVTAQMGAGAEYFLSPAGDDANTGTREAPWQTLEKAAAEIEAGDTVTLLPGSYPGRFEPAASGTADAPIVLRAEPRREAVLIGSGDDGYPLLLRNLSHLRIEGLTIRPDPARSRWMLVENCSYIEIDDCRMEDGAGGMPAYITGCDQVRVSNSIIHRYQGGNMFRVGDSTRVVIEGCSISRAGHSPLQFFPTGSNSQVVVRGNIMHGAWGRHGEHFNTDDVLFEGNIISHSVNSGRSADAMAQFMWDTCIFRFNRVFHNFGAPIVSSPWGDDLYFRNVRLYNNVFDRNPLYGYQVQVRSPAFADRVGNVVFANNVFAGNDPHGAHRQIMLVGRENPDFFRMVSNVLTADEPGRPVINDFRHGEDSLLTVAEAEERYPDQYIGNLDVDPGFARAEIYDHSLLPDSPLRDAGAPLATAVGAGEGNVLAVDDVYPFYDGFGIAGEVGDMIAVGSPEQQARVIEKDYDNSTLRLDRSVSWQDGDPVSLPWSGAAPDIGAYEHGPDGYPSVQIVADPFEARPGESITFRAEVRGAIDPVSVLWHLGDDTVAEGMEVAHSYAEDYDYPVTVIVTDSEGRRHLAAGYVWVETPRAADAPLVHSTFERDDSDWWWLWQTYRPGPAAWERLIDDETGQGVLRVHAPSDGGRMPCWTHPPRWDIDRDHTVRIRYRVGEGTPVALYLRAFAIPGDSLRRVCVAASPAARPSEGEVVSDYVLVDDEQWHEIEFDARLIRERYPQITRIEGLRFHGTPREAVEEGQWFELDEVWIGP